LTEPAETASPAASPHTSNSRDGDKFIYHFKGGNVQSTIRRRVRDVEQRIEVLDRDPIPKPPRQLSFDAPLTDDAGRAGTVRLRDARVNGRLSLDRLDVAAGDRLLVTGANGSGKSTLLSIVAGLVRLDSGSSEVSARRIGLLPQDVHFSRPELTPQQVYVELTGAPVPLGDLGLLHPRELSRPVGVLSVGQQRRLALAVLVAQRPDLLLLDEPTNHISLTLASDLEEALSRARGTVLLASHDRWLRARWTGQQLSL